MTRHLAADEIASVEIHDAPLRLEVVSGAIWVTQERDSVDYVLVAPAVQTFRHPGRLVIEALEDAELTISSEPSESPSVTSFASVKTVRAPTRIDGALTVVEANLERSDHQAAVRTLTQAYACDPMGNGRPLPEHVLADLIPGLRAHPTTRIWLAFVEDEPAGIATCFEGFSTFYARPLINIHDVAVLPQHRGKGVGKALLGAVEQRARTLRCCKLTLEVLEHNYTARRLYERAGFGQAVYTAAAGGALFYAKSITSNTS